MFEFHTDPQRYFEIQLENTEEYVIPFIEKKIAWEDGCRDLEIGCGEGGVLEAFLKKDCIGVGVELNPSRLLLAANFLEKELKENKVRLIAADIYDTDEKELGGGFNLIVMKDVI